MMVARWLIIFSLFFYCDVFAEVQDIGVDELKKLLNKNVVIIDVRTPKEWQQTGIVEGSIPIMFFDERRKANPDQWMRAASSYISPGKELILICRSGNRSKTIGNFLTKQFGYHRVYNVKGGIKQWLKEGNKTIRSE